MVKDTVTAAALLIGDELLSGRTKDINLAHIAERLTDVGIDLREARIVPDVEDEIVAALDALRARHDYVFTTGDIGPTHDDITADAVARAFGVGISVSEEAVAIMRARYETLELNEARLRMARIPHGGTMIANPVSAAPGFNIGNVYVMAGVPRIMQAMLENILPTLEHGRPMLSRTVRVDTGEGNLAGPLKAIQARYDTVSLGSYPFTENGRFGANIVLRSKDEAALVAAETEVVAMAAELVAMDLPAPKAWT
jgi:molybdenum cofactor synthesis domain-containing protein